MKVLETRPNAAAAAGPGAARHEVPAPVAAGHPTGESRRLRLSTAERFALLEQFATLIDSGIQIASALQSMRQQSPDPRIAGVLGALEQGVVAGSPLSAAMASMPRAFPPLLTQMVRAGEASGDLAGMLRRTVESMELEATMRGKLQSALIYPSVMLVMTLGVVVFLLTYIVPKFEKLFRGKQLPLPTRILMALGEGAQAYGLYALAGLVVLLVGAVLFLRTPRGGRLFDGFVLGAPVLRRVYRTAVIARCVRTLGLLLQTGVPLHAALEHTQEVAVSPSYRSLWQRARHNVTNGGSLLDVIRNSPLFDPTFEQLVAAGEATATLDKVMTKAAAQYTKELERRLRDLMTLIEPAMVVLMGGVVGFVAMSIMLPIFRMSRG
ncbi:MAG: type II secretion system F family protein [Planctomycetes bacterium]|nr:type II secretion system F family protein [Planctomycetota bacterium]